MYEKCYHCGLDCELELIRYDEKNFCCNGCKTVYEILNQDKLQNYYQLNPSPGIKPIPFQEFEFEFLEEEVVQEQLLLFKDDTYAVVEFKIPVIHCSSCVWVLENLSDINPNIVHAHVKFTQKTIKITYKWNELSLQKLAEFLTELGYKPAIFLDDTQEGEFQKKYDNELLIKLGIAGFCFGNIMLFALPEYTNSFTDVWFEKYKVFFRFLMLALSLPVVFYSATGYFKSAYKGIRNSIINIDIPISLGILVLFLRSVYEVAFNLSSGYFDSLSGLVFFMLVGKYFQQNTYKSLSFERDFKSFYPLSVNKWVEGKWVNSLINTLEIGDRVRLRNQEMVPADAVLIKGLGTIDNSFITGESALVEKTIGDKIFAGGKQIGQAIEIELVKKVNQSYLTQIWQNAGQEDKHSYFSTLIEKISKYFTIAVIAIAFLGGLYWFFVDESKMFEVVSAVLIVACPCALALSTPFVLGNILRILGRNSIYCKDITTLEKVQSLNSIVLDKTGTLTEINETELDYIGQELSSIEKEYISQLAENSTHPLSRKLVQFLGNSKKEYSLQNFEESVGKGIKGYINEHWVKFGSNSWVGGPDAEKENSAVHITIDNTYKGKFELKNFYRKNIPQIVEELPQFHWYLLSGDNAKEKETLDKLFNKKVELHFQQSPEDKYEFIKKLQKTNAKVMMIGDGLNDAAALKKSNVGVAITDDVNSFTPSSEVILKGEKLIDLPKLIAFSKKGVNLVKVNMGISFLYNIVGLSFALSGMLSPIVAAILMPVSSLSVVAFSTLSTWYYGNKFFVKN